MPATNGFTLAERLKRERHIEALFQSGKALSVFPLRVVWSLVPRAEGEASPARAGFSAPKKKFKRAHDRNRLKRLMREAWRLQKQDFYAHIPAEKQLHIFWLFTGAELVPYAMVEAAVAKALSKLTKEISAAE